MILDKTYLGSTEIEKIYLGSNVVYELTPIVTNLYSWSDPATPTPNESATFEKLYPSGTDMTGLDGWIEFGGVEILSNSNLDYVSDGTHSVEIKSLTIGGSDNANLFFNVEIGKTYTLSFWAKRNLNDGILRGSSGWVTGPPETNFTSVGTIYTFNNLVANATQATVTLWSNRTDATTLNSLFIDNVTLIEN